MKIAVVPKPKRCVLILRILFHSENVTFLSWDNDHNWITQEITSEMSKTLLFLALAKYEDSNNTKSIKIQR